MTVKHLFPAVEPSLNLDFANSKKLDPRITFTRSSTGTYVDSNGVIKTAAADEARFDHDGGTGNSLGLLVEESRTNAITYSTAPDAEFSQDSTYFTYTFNQAAPDGTNTAHLITNTSNTSTNRGGQFSAYATIPTTGKITVSVFVKPVGSQRIYLGGDDGNQGYYGVPIVYYDFTVSPPQAVVNSNSGTQAAFGLTAEAFLEDIGNGWYRLIEVIDLTGHAFANGQTRGPRVCPVTTGTSCYVWGYQIETGSFATSYIPTSGSTVTRSADVASMTASPYLYGTFLARYKHQPPTNLYRQIFSVGNANAYTAFVCRTKTNDSVNIVLPGVIDLASTANTETSGFNNVATARVVGDYAVCLNGGTVAKTSSTSDQTNNSVITFMYGTTGATSGGHIARLTYYPFRLTDAQLEALTL